MKLAWKAGSLAGVLSLLLAFSCMAGPNVGKSYTYNYWGEPVEAPDAYRAARVVRAEDSGLLPFKEPGDVFVDARRDSRVYVADTGRNRVVVYDKEFVLLRVIETVYNEEREEALNAPSGVFVDADGRILIAEKGGKRVVALDENDRILAQYKRPQSEVAFNGIDFLPAGVLADEDGFVYVLCEGLLEGAVLYNREGVFQGYYGANMVEDTLSVVLDNFWKRFLNQEQRSKIKKNVPDQMSGFDIGPGDFVYTCTEISKTNKNQIKKLNPVGVDVLENGQNLLPAYSASYGDLKPAYFEGKTERSAFVDICCDERGNINVLDFSKGRIFQYSGEGQLLCVFGGLSSQVGAFEKCVALDDMDGGLLVLDAGKNNLTLFQRTAYIKAVYQALDSYGRGEFRQAEEDWLEVIRLNANLELAYSGVGKALYDQGRYEEARDYLRRGNDKAGYEKAFQYRRSAVIRKSFPYLLTGAVLLGTAAFAAGGLRRRRRKERGEGGHG